MNQEMEEQMKSMLDARGLQLLRSAAKHEVLENTIESFMQDNQANSLLQTYLWVEPFLYYFNLYSVLAVEEAKVVALSYNIDLKSEQGTDWLEAYSKQLLEQYQNFSKPFLPYYKQFNNYFHSYSERKTAPRHREDYRHQDRYHRQYVLKQKKTDDKLKEDKLKEQQRKAEEQRIQNQRLREEQLKREVLALQQQKRLRQQEEARKRPKVTQFRKMSFAQFNQLMARLGTVKTLLSNGLDQRVADYQARGKREEEISQSMFESKYADRKSNKHNVTIIKAVKDSKPVKTEQISRMKKSTKVQQVCGLMRAVEAPELVELKQKIRSENFVQKSKELAVSEIDQFRREAKFNLNLLTPENFQQLVPEFTKLAFKKGLECCKVLVEELVFKSWNQQKYCQLYANLSRQLSKRKEKDVQNQFRVTLISEVESYFHSKDEVLDKSAPGFDQQLKKQKSRKLGNVKLICELLKLKVLKLVVAQICYFKLLRNYVLELGENPAAELNVEGLIVLFDKSGRFLQENYKAVSEIQPQNKLLKKISAYFKGQIEGTAIAQIFQEQVYSTKCSFNFYFKVFEMLQKHEPLSYRLRALIKNLLLKKERGWVETNKTDGPKKLKQLFDDEDQQSANQSKFIRKEQIANKLRDYFSSDMQYSSLLRKVKYLKESCRITDLLQEVLVGLCDGRHDAVRSRKFLVADLTLEAKDARSVFLTAWHNKFNQLVSLSSDQLFLPAVLSHNFRELLKEKVLSMSDLKKQFAQDEDQQREFYYQVMTKLVGLEGNLQTQANGMVSELGHGPIDLKSKTANKNLFR